MPRGRSLLARRRKSPDARRDAPLPPAILLPKAAQTSDTPAHNPDCASKVHENSPLPPAILLPKAAQTSDTPAHNPDCASKVHENSLPPRLHPRHSDIPSPVHIVKMHRPVFEQRKTPATPAAFSFGRP